MRSNILRLGFFSFYSAAVNALFWTIYPVYLRDLGLSGVEFGGLGAISSFMAGVVSLTFGRAADGMRVKRSLIALETASAPLFLLVLPGKMHYLILYSLLGGTIFSASWIAMNVLVSRCASDVEGEYPLVMAAQSLGVAAGGAMGWIPKLMARGGPLLPLYRQVILWLPLAYVLGVAILLGVEEPEPPARGAARIVLRPFARVLVVDLLIGLGAGITVHNFDFYLAKKFGVTSAELGTLMLIENALMGLFNLRAKWFAVRTGGPVNLYLISSIPAVVLLALIPFLGSWELVVVVAAARTVLMNIVNPIYSAALLRAFGPRLYGTLTGSRSLVWSFSIAPGRLLGGMMLDVYLDLPLFVTSAIYSIALALVATLVKPLLSEGVGKQLGEGELPGEAPAGD